MFQVVDYSAPDPALNLAIDEALLNAVEANEHPAVLRFWESPTVFAVIGVGQKIAEEANLDRCDADGVPVHRRCSAGGAVVQGPGSLNYTLCLPYDVWPECKLLRESYCQILKAILVALKARGIAASIEGTSDLAIEGRKFSGNAQKRKRSSFLHHGTLLYGDALPPIAEYLAEPKQRPDYRGDRPHDAFVRSLQLKREPLLEAVCDALETSGQVSTSVDPSILEAAEHLAETKYRTHEWNYRR